MRLNSIAGTDISLDPKENRQKALEALPRLRELGNWPPYIDGEASIVERIPLEDTTAPGFDAGIACVLDLIPRSKQRLSCILHAAYTEEAVEQVRRESADLDPDSETCWWLAASRLCQGEVPIGSDAFGQQLTSFLDLVENPEKRLHVARCELLDMLKLFRLVDGLPFAIRDGGLQGAYIMGYDWGLQYIEAIQLFFIGTFRESLGLENFAFSDRVDDQGRSMSGPVHGSRQFVKVSSFVELPRALAVVEAHLGKPKK